MRQFIIYNHDETERDYDADIQLVEPITEIPRLYKVVMLNDDYTPMDFVVMVLMEHFDMNEAQAMQVMLNVHEKGRGVCGVYTRDIAETKALQVMRLANEYENPLTCEIELA